MLRKSEEVTKESIKRGTSELNFDKLLFICAILNQLLDEEFMVESGMPRILEPLPSDWPTVQPGDGQPPTIGQLAFPGMHYHIWGICYVEHPGYTYTKRPLNGDGVDVWYFNEKLPDVLEVDPYGYDS